MTYGEGEGRAERRVLRGEERERETRTSPRMA